MIIGAEEYKHHQIPDVERFNLSEEQEIEWEGKVPTEPKSWKVGAYEPCSGITGWIEFLYIIDLTQKPVSYEIITDKTEEEFDKY